jgi:hypothetical protein
MRRYPNNDVLGRDVMQHHRVCSDNRVITDDYVPEDGRSGADNDSRSKGRICMTRPGTVAMYLPKGYSMQNRAVDAYNSTATNNYSLGMPHHKPLADTAAHQELRASNSQIDQRNHVCKPHLRFGLKPHLYPEKDGRLGPWMGNDDS